MWSEPSRGHGARTRWPSAPIGQPAQTGMGSLGDGGESSVVFELVLDPPAVQPTRISPNDDQCHRPRPSAVTARSGWLGASSAFRLLQP